MSKSIVLVVTLFVVLITLQFSFSYIFKTFIVDGSNILWGVLMSIDLSFLVLITAVKFYFGKNLLAGSRIPDYKMLLFCILSALVISIIYPLLNFQNWVGFFNEAIPFDFSFREIEFKQVTFFDIYYYFRIVLLMPILEELFYRKIMIDSIKNRYSVFWVITISSLLFAVGHLDIHFFSTAFIVGVVLGLFYHKTNNILVPIIVHSLINVFVVLLF